MGDWLTGAEPLARVEMESLHEARGPDPELRRQRCEDLQLRGGHDGPESELRGRAGQPGQEQCLGLVAGHPGQPRAVAIDQPEASPRAALSVDRHTRRTQRLDITVDRPFGDLELGRELGGGQLAASLEEEQERHEAGCAHPATIR